MSKWVQHISGQGEKWRICQDKYCSDIDWQVEAVNGIDHHYLPKSEYVECEPPIEWEECTREVFGVSARGLHAKATAAAHIYSGDCGILTNGYRWAWKGDALIVERKKQ